MWRAFDLMVERATMCEVHGGKLERDQSLNCRKGRRASLGLRPRDYQKAREKPTRDLREVKRLARYTQENLGRRRFGIYRRFYKVKYGILVLMLSGVRKAAKPSYVTS